VDVLVVVFVPVVVIPPVVVEALPPAPVVPGYV
jgi:hypothetical protein